MLLGYSHVINSVRKFLFKGVQARALAHRRGDRHDPLVFTSRLNQRLDRDLRIGRSRRLLRRRARFPHKRRTGMEPYRVFLGRLIAQALLRDDMKENRPSHLEHVLEGRKQMLEVMAVDWTGVAESQFFEEQPWEDGSLGQLFRSPGQLLDVVSDVRDFPQ